MSLIREDSWSGWIDIQPIEQDGGDKDGEVDPSGSGGVGERAMTRLQFDLRFAPMDA